MAALPLREDPMKCQHFITNPCPREIWCRMRKTVRRAVNPLSINRQIVVAGLSSAAFLLILMVFPFSQPTTTAVPQTPITVTN